MAYLISNTTRGVYLGIYEGATPLDAYRAAMADRGYRTQADAEAAGYSLEAIPDNLWFVEVDTNIANHRGW